MANWLSAAIFLLYIGIGGQGAPSPDSQNWRPNSAYIHILGDDSLLKVFEHCRPVRLDNEEATGNSDGIVERAKWDRERWWYTLAHVCRKWRRIVLTSASHLDLSLVLTYGTPVADMMAHSLPLPIVIDYGDEDREVVTVEDEEGILLALQRRRRVRRIRLWMPAPNLRKLVVALDGEYPMLEYLYIKPLTNDDNGLILPETFRASRLRHCALEDITHSHIMSHLPPPPSFQSAEQIGQCARNCGSRFWRSLRIFIHILDDDLLLSIFYLCQPPPSDEDEADSTQILPWGGWGQHWYKLAQVCRRWRYLVLESASNLGSSLVCTYGTPVADMLALSPHFPLVLDYSDEDGLVTAQDEGGILLALQRRRRVRRIRLWMPASNLRKLVVALDGEFPMLEYLNIRPLTNDNNGLILPETFKAPQLRRFTLRNVTYSHGMVHLRPPTPRVQPDKGVDQCTRCVGSQRWRSMRMFIHILNDDSLLEILHLCRPVLLDDDEVGEDPLLLGGDWNRERWWYRFAHVCRRWRYLILTSAFHLGLSLLCTYGTPVADMLAHSPPFPLIISHVDDDHVITAEDEEGILLALQHRDRVRHIRLRMPVPILQKLIVAMDDEFPMLEYLYIYIAPPSKDNTRLILPNTFQAPDLRHLVLRYLAVPIRSLLLTTAVGLVTLSLQRIHPSTYFHPNDLLQRLSLLPQLETLGITFQCPVPSRDVERQLLHTPIMTHVTLPNLRWFAFGGTSAYLDALLPLMTTPILEKLQILFFLELNFSIPHLAQFLSTTESLVLGSASFQFYGNVLTVYVYPREGARTYTLYIEVLSHRFDWQVASAAPIFQAMGTVCSGVEHLSLEYQRQSVSLEPSDGADRSLWRGLLMLFSSVKTLRVGIGDDFIRQLSRSLRSEDGEPAMELLPQLKELRFPAGRGTPDALDAFLDARKDAGHPLSLIRY